MSGTHTSDRFAAIILAAGNGSRMGGDVPKQFRTFRGMPLITHSIKAMLAANADPIILVIGADQENIILPILEKFDGVQWVVGGETRQQSVINGLLALNDCQPDRVLIHDAARPDLSQEVIERVLAGLVLAPGAIPVLPVVDSLTHAAADEMMGPGADRDSLRRVQTPQGFRFADIVEAHKNWSDEKSPTDDAQVLAQNGGNVALVRGDERLKKITFAEDLMGDDEKSGNTKMPMRIGQGFDVHRLVEGEELWLCGLKIEHDKGLAGHSDADVALHAVTDAILGAIAAGDIGTYFPPSDVKWKSARSDQFLKHALELAAQAGYNLGNLDVTIICEAPKIGPHRDAMRARLSEIVNIPIGGISVKATTSERLGFTGRGEGIAAQAIVAMIPMD